jgi:hypothetical protein
MNTVISKKLINLMTKSEQLLAWKVVHLNSGVNRYSGTVDTDPLAVGAENFKVRKLSTY